MAYEPKTWVCGEKITAEKLNAIERGVADMNTEYVPTEWACGDTITAEKLNHMEQGIANGGGECDFSTARVTVICEDGTLIFPAGIPHIVNDELVVDSFSVTPGNDVTMIAPLYKGKLVIPQSLFPNATTVPTVTGDIDINFNTGITITGDGTISANANVIN